MKTKEAKIDYNVLLIWTRKNTPFREREARKKWRFGTKNYRFLEHKIDTFTCGAEEEKTNVNRYLFESHKTKTDREKDMIIPKTKDWKVNGRAKIINGIDTTTTTTMCSTIIFLFGIVTFFFEETRKRDTGRCGNDTHSRSSIVSSQVLSNNGIFLDLRTSTLVLLKRFL